MFKLLAVLLLMGSLQAKVDPLMIRNKLSSINKKFNQCYRKSKKVGVQMKIFVNFKIDENGNTVSVKSVPEVPLAFSIKVAKCMDQYVKEIKFPSEKGRSLIEVSQPFNFR